MSKDTKILVVSRYSPNLEYNFNSQNYVMVTILQSTLAVAQLLHWLIPITNLAPINISISVILLLDICPKIEYIVYHFSTSILSPITSPSTFNLIGPSLFHTKDLTSHLFIIRGGSSLVLFMWKRRGLVQRWESNLRILPPYLLNRPRIQHNGITNPQMNR